MILLKMSKVIDFHVPRCLGKTMALVVCFRIDPSDVLKLPGALRFFYSSKKTIANAKTGYNRPAIQQRNMHVLFVLIVNIILTVFWGAFVIPKWLTNGS